MRKTDGKNCVLQVVWKEAGPAMNEHPYPMKNMKKIPHWIASRE
jgi:hypothetical protein